MLSQKVESTTLTVKVTEPDTSTPIYKDEECFEAVDDFSITQSDAQLNHTFQDNDGRNKGMPEVATSMRYFSQVFC